MPHETYLDKQEQLKDLKIEKEILEDSIIVSQIRVERYQTSLKEDTQRLVLLNNEILQLQGRL